MKKIWVCALFLAGAAALAAQQSGQDPYEGTSNPPPDSTIKIAAPQASPSYAKPAPGRLANSGSGAAASDAARVPPQPSAAAASVNDAAATSGDGTDDGIVMLAPDGTTQPKLNQRQDFADPDGDIVHPAPPPRGTLAYGTEIRARLKGRVSTAYNEPGDTFQAVVASDVIQRGNVLIPAGSEIDGTITQVSMGHFAGHGSMVLQPRTVILPDGAKYRLYAEVTATPGSATRVGTEGQILPGSRAKKDAIEYGAVAGTGAVTGAALAGPPGALAGTLAGAGAVTFHLMMDHPQATLESGTVLDFSLTEPLRLTPDDGPQSSSMAAPAGSDTAQ